MSIDNNILNFNFTLNKWLMKSLLFIGILIAIVQLSFAQGSRERFRDKFEDVNEEEENQNLTLRFFNALNGDPINGATVTVGEIGEYTSDAEGKVRFPAPEEDGIILVHFECPKFITCDFKIEVIAGTLFFNRFSVSPMLDLTYVRIVLDWDQAPGDLDAHFVKDNSYHISFRNTQVLADGSAGLDRDDMDGYGPETITVKNVDDLGLYEFLVHDWTDKDNPNSTNLSSSKATVKVYGEGRLLYVFQIPDGATGNIWSVFQIQQGQFVETNEVGN
jgi:hypothetical protein